MISKKDLTTIFLECGGVTIKDEAELNKYIWLWWRNPISKTSLRLTKEGHEFLRDRVQLQSYRIKLVSGIRAITKNFLLIDKYLSSPFYIESNKTIFFYGEQDTLMVTLNGFNLQQYLENFERS